MGCCPKPSSLFARSRVRGPVRALLGPSTGQFPYAPRPPRDMIVGPVRGDIVAPVQPPQRSANEIFAEWEALSHAGPQGKDQVQWGAELRSLWIRFVRQNEVEGRAGWHFATCEGGRSFFRGPCVIRQAADDSAPVLRSIPRVTLVQVEPSEAERVFQLLRQDTRGPWTRVRSLAPGPEVIGYTRIGAFYPPPIENAYAMPGLPYSEPLVDIRMQPRGDIVRPSTGQLFRTLPAGGVASPSVRTPPVAIQPRPLPPGQVTRNAIIESDGAALFTDLDRLRGHGYRPDLAMAIPGGTIVEKISFHLYHVQEPGRPWQGWSYYQVRVPSLGLAGFVRWDDLRENQFEPFLFESETGQLFRTLPAGGVVAPSVRTPPVAIQPRPLPPDLVTSPLQPLFSAIVAAPPGERGLIIRSWTSMAAPFVGLAINGEVVSVYQIGIRDTHDGCDRCQWWWIAGGQPIGGVPPPGAIPPPPPNTPGPPGPGTGRHPGGGGFGGGPGTPVYPPAVGFVRAIGPQGEWNLRRVG